MRARRPSPSVGSAGSSSGGGEGGRKREAFSRIRSVTKVTFLHTLVSVFSLPPSVRWETVYPSSFLLQRRTLIK